MKYHAKFSRVFEVTIEADSIVYAEKLVEGVIKQFPADTCKMLSIHVDGYVDLPNTTIEASGVELSKEAQAIIARNSGLAAAIRALDDRSPGVA